MGRGAGESEFEPYLALTLRLRGNLGAMAQEIGVGRATRYRRIEAVGLELRAFRASHRVFQPAWSGVAPDQATDDRAGLRRTFSGVTKEGNH